MVSAPAYEQAKGVFDSFKSAFEAEPCDLQKCGQLLAQLKLLVFSGTAGPLSAVTGSSDTAKERSLARETLELACFLSIRNKDLASFERHVAQLKMYYNDQQNGLEQSKQQHPILGLYLLHLLAADRIGEFHTELELIPVDDHENQYIKQPVQLERHLMEGNYAKILEAQKDVPKEYYPLIMEKLLETVRHKVGASLERSYEKLPAEEAAKMLILSGGIPALQEFAMKENERKAQEEMDDPMGDCTPSLSRRQPVGAIRWEVKDSTIFFRRQNEKRLEIPALDLMVNTIGYATDLERIV
eukprot:gnl/TRDRNA2_/TRDRNA2_132652_c0_seq3.p1 gnl/TRDRNA2_/TRDRNA2_132652_c0~~gnl/TRDRNA2_/TRDRNA2_132652_c0_seq3.p1  ORF type:complete len:327 (+),score=75.52 gnl/TRDRNA2_/TRDRNA2_132652_c0_seq3:87-983(+)